MFERITDTGFILIILVHIGLLVAAVLSFVFYITRKDSRIYKHLKVLSGPVPLPIVGNALSFIGPHEKLLDLLFHWVKIYGTCFSVWIGNIPYVFMASPKDIEKILSSTVHINKGKDYDQFLSDWLGTGLLTASRGKWHSRRKLLTPTFHFKILEDFIPIFNEQAKILTAVLEKQRQMFDAFDICPFISKCSLDVICETAMGEKINAQIGGEENYVKTVCGITDILLVKGLNPVFRTPYIWNMTSLGKLESKYLKNLHDFTDKMIKDRKADRKRKLLIASAKQMTATIAEQDNPEGTKTRKAFLDLLLDLQDSENKLTDADIREEVDTFMFEGHDTTGANLDWAILMMACNPECQRRVHEELDTIFENDIDRDITTADLKQMKYLECCIKETLRLYPSVPFFMRSVDQDIPLDEKRVVPKGATIIISAITLHRIPETFPNPEKFDPERFTPESSTGRHPYSYIPFSAGPRNCIGQKFALYEEKIILASLLRKFRVEAVDTVDTVVPLPDVILRPKYGIRVRLVNREHEYNAKNLS